MAIINVGTAALLRSALGSAVSGDTIRLAAGDYGDLAISGRSFTTDVVITSAEAGNPAEFNSLSVTSSAGLHFTNVTFNLTPTAATTSFSSVVKVSNSSHITFTGGVVESSPAHSSDLLLARGFTLEKSNGVTIENMEITQVNKGVVLATSSNVVIRGNDMHDFRTSSIVGASSDHVLIDGNHLANSHPSAGDHADFIHLWTAAKDQTGPTTDLVIVNNTLDSGGGVPPLGIYLDDSGDHLGFTHVTIADNLILGAVGQGMRLESVSESAITGNTLLQTGPITTHTPGIVLAASHGIDISGNATAFVSADAASAVNVHDNIFVQNTKPLAENYYTAQLVTQVSASHDPSAAHAYFTTSTIEVGGKQQANGRGEALTGGGGDDTLVGMAGSDTLSGGAGADQLIGNRDSDRLTGGDGADLFVFGKDHPLTGGADTISDFSSAQHDRLNVHSIDANVGATGDQNFTLIGTQAFDHVVGELRYSVVGSGVVVQGDINGDGAVDFSIKLLGVHSLQTSDFIL